MEYDEDLVEVICRLNLHSTSLRLYSSETASSSESFAASSLAATVSQGYNSKMEPMLSTGGGVYRLVNIKLDTSYSVRVR